MTRTSHSTQVEQAACLIQLLFREQVISHSQVSVQTCLEEIDFEWIDLERIDRHQIGLQLAAGGEVLIEKDVLVIGQEMRIKSSSSGGNRLAVVL